MADTSTPISSTTAFIIFQVIRLGASILTGVILAKSGLPLAEIGTYEILLYIGGTLSFFWVSGLLQGIISFYGKSTETEQKALIFQVFFIFICIATLLAALLLWGQSWILPLMTGQKTIPYFGLFILYLAFNLPTFPVETIYLLHDKAYRILGWGCIIFSLHLCAIFIPLWLGLGLQGILWGLLMLAFLKFLWAITLMFQWGTINLDRNQIQNYLMLCMPLVATTLVSNFMLFWDNWLVNWYYQSPETFAIFRYGAREFPLALALCTGLGTALVPVMSESLPIGMAELKRKGLRLMHLLFPLTILLLFVSKPLFPLVFSGDFERSAGIFNIFLVITATRVLLPGSILLGIGQVKSIFWFTLLELFVRVALSLALIPYFGLLGVAWGIVLSFWVEKIGLIWVLETRHHIKINDWLHLRWYLFYTILLFTCVWHCN